MTPQRGIGLGLALLAALLLVPGVLKAAGAGGAREIDASRVSPGAGVTANLEPGTFELHSRPAGRTGLAVRFAGAVEETQALPVTPGSPPRLTVPSAGRYLLTADAGASYVLAEPADPDVLGALPRLLLGAILAFAGISMLLGRDPRVAFRRWSGASSG